MGERTWIGIAPTTWPPRLDGSTREPLTWPRRWQLPFDYQPDTFLHPPVALLLFLPFRWLPAFFWYVIPIAVVSVLVARWRPAQWTWPIMAACLAWPRTSGMLIVGNTDLWVAAFVALGLSWGWGWALVALKPSFAPLALLGVRRRSFWIAVTVVGAVSIPFGRLWLDWFSVVVHAPGGILYSILGLPLVLLPAVAYAGQTATARPTGWQPGPSASARRLTSVAFRRP